MDLATKKLVTWIVCLRSEQVFIRALSNVSVLSTDFYVVNMFV